MFLLSFSIPSVLSSSSPLSAFSRIMAAPSLLILFIAAVAFLIIPMVTARSIPSNPLLRHRHILEEERVQPGEVTTNRIGEGTCSKDDVDVYQAASSPLPSGIPTYTVQVINTCLGGGAVGIAEVHLSCGWFSSARLVNPKVFRRLSYDDCLVNDGRSIPPGGAISFEYANTYPYKLAVSSASYLSRKSR